MSTIGIDEEKVRKYVKYQEEREKREEREQEQFGLFQECYALPLQTTFSEDGR